MVAQHDPHTARPSLIYVICSDEAGPPHQIGVHSISYPIRPTRHNFAWYGVHQYTFAGFKYTVVQPISSMLWYYSQVTTTVTMRQCPMSFFFCYRCFLAIVTFLLSLLSRCRCFLAVVAFLLSLLSCCHSSLLSFFLAVIPSLLPELGLRVQIGKN